MILNRNSSFQSKLLENRRGGDFFLWPIEYFITEFSSDTESKAPCISGNLELLIEEQTSGLDVRVLHFVKIFKLKLFIVKFFRLKF